MGDLTRISDREVIPFQEGFEESKCSGCGTTRPARYLANGVCSDCGLRASYVAQPFRFLSMMGCPRRYSSSTLSTWRGDLPRAAAEWIAMERTQRPDVLIWGPTGTGKTHLGTALLFEHVMGAKDIREDLGRWRSARGYLEDLKHEFKSEDNVVTDRYVAAPSLLLDDLGAELLSGERGEWRRDRVGFVICERYDRKLPTIVTTNLEPEQIIAIDARIWSRLSAATVIHLTGKDRRVEKFT